MMVMVVLLGIRVVLVGVVDPVCQGQVCDWGGYNGGRMKTATLGVVAGRHVETKDGRPLECCLQVATVHQHQ